MRESEKNNSPLSLQSLCRYEFQRSITTISPTITSITPTPYFPRVFSFTPDVINHLLLVTKLKLLYSVARIYIEDVDFDSFEKTDLEKFLRIVKYSIKFTNVKSIEKILSASDGLIPFGKESSCRHMSSSSKLMLCYSHFSQEHYGKDWTDCTCRSDDGIGIAFEGINFSSPAKVRLLINFLKNIRNASFSHSIKTEGNEKKNNDYLNCNFHFDIETLKSEISSLKNTKCKKITFFTRYICGNENKHISPVIVKDLATIIDWK